MDQRSSSARVFNGGHAPNGTFCSSSLAGFDLEEVSADGDGVFLLEQNFDDLAGLGGVDGDVNLCDLVQAQYEGDVS